MTYWPLCSYFVLMESSSRFKPPWTLVRENSECYIVRDANGVALAWLFCRDDSQRYSFGASKLTSGEARRIGKAISRIPEFMMPRKGFYPRGEGKRWRTDRPYHVALQDQYIREHWSEIDSLCRLNSLPSMRRERSSRLRPRVGQRLRPPSPCGIG